MRRWAGAAALPLLGTLLVACGAGSPPADRPGPAAAGTTPSADTSVSGMFDVDGRELFLECWGEGEPTIVLEVGEGRLHEDMTAVRTAYDSELRVCSYDRANKGRSGEAPTPRTGAALVDDLHALLETAGVPGPYVLVGHSAGGLIVQAYAAAHPDEVSGVVALNPLPPWDLWSSVGLREMSPLEREDERAFFAGANGESLDYRDLSRELARHPRPSHVPLHVVISTVSQCPVPDSVCGRTYPAYEAVLEQVTREWGRGRLTQVDASHEVHSDAPDAVRAAIDDVLERAGS